MRHRQISLIINELVVAAVESDMDADGIADMVREAFVEYDIGLGGESE